MGVALWAAPLFLWFLGVLLSLEAQCHTLAALGRGLYGCMGAALLAALPLRSCGAEIPLLGGCGAQGCTPMAFCGGLLG